MESSEGRGVSVARIIEGLSRLGVGVTCEGPEWFTRAEVEQAIGLGTSQTGVILRRAVHAGVLETGKVEQRQIDGVVKRVTAYRFVGGADELGTPGTVATLGTRIRRDRGSTA